MNKTISIAAMCLVLMGCQDKQAAEPLEAPPLPETAAAKPAAPKPEMPTPDIEPSDIVWADEAFFEEAGVKQGQDVIYLPTPPMVVDKMIEMADISESDLVYDLGTGDGRIAIAVAQQRGSKTIGYEIDAALASKARENVRVAGVEHLVTIEEKDILTLDFSQADVVLMYLNTKLNVRLLPQLRKLKDGARVVSHDWGMEDKIQPDLVIENFKSEKPDFVNLHTLYLWKAPFRPGD
jgi:SAM-dependent methyltransferase